MIFIDPEREALEHFLAEYPADKPVVMLNLLRFSERACYEAGQDVEPCSGREAYDRYGAGVAPCLAAAGAEPFWLGSQAAMLIGPQDKDWHQVILVRYPSAQAFIDMVRSPEYQAIAFHRTAALDDSRLIALTEG